MLALVTGCTDMVAHGSEGVHATTLTALKMFVTVKFVVAEPSPAVVAFVADKLPRPEVSV
jgi:hypothetical protein